MFSPENNEKKKMTEETLEPNKYTNMEIKNCPLK